MPSEIDLLEDLGSQQNTFPWIKIDFNLKHSI